MSQDNRWSLPTNPPPPLFLGKKERNYVKQLNDEINERIVGQTVIYYPIDLKTTNFHSLYGEAIEKSFLLPVRVYALVKWDGDETNTDISILDKMAKITINFHRRRLTQDQDLFVREGDFVLFAKRFWEITKLAEPRLLFGQQDQKFEIRAECVRARDGLFPEPDIINEIQYTVMTSDSLTQDEIVTLLEQNDIVVLSGDDPQFIDMYTNPSNYNGRIIYLTSVSATIVPPFIQRNRFYYNSNGIWTLSSLFQGF